MISKMSGGFVNYPGQGSTAPDRKKSGIRWVTPHRMPLLK
jgi:hypothetical protein